MVAAVSGPASATYSAASRVVMCSKTIFRPGKVAAQRDQLAVDEHALAVEQVDLAVGHLAVHQQRHAGALHGLQGGVGQAQVGHTGIAVGGGAGRVKLDSHHPCRLGPHDFLGWQAVGQVERHQRLEIQAVRQRREDALAVGLGLGRGGDRRLQVGHHDGAGKLPCGVGQHGGQGHAVAQVQVPVVGAGQGEGVAHPAILHPGRWLACCCHTQVAVGASEDEPAP